MDWNALIVEKQVLRIGRYQTWAGELELVASRLPVLREYTEAPEMRFGGVSRSVR
jgi:hypothetical protein